MSKVLIIISICILLTYAPWSGRKEELFRLKAAAGNTELRNLGFESLDLSRGTNRQFEGLTLNLLWKTIYMLIF